MRLCLRCTPSLAVRPAARPLPCPLKPRDCEASSAVIRDSLSDRTANTCGDASGIQLLTERSEHNSFASATCLRRRTPEWWLVGCSDDSWPCPLACLLAPPPNNGKRLVVRMHPRYMTSKDAGHQWCLLLPLHLS
jgi:hypothetical protein